MPRDAEGKYVELYMRAAMQPTPCIAEFEMASALAPKAIALANSSGMRNLLMITRATSRLDLPSR